jgi:hypothetical protein
MQISEKSQALLAWLLVIFLAAIHILPFVMW